MGHSKFSQISKTNYKRQLHDSIKAGVKIHCTIENAEQLQVQSPSIFAL